jgi:predicted anti-sigma-YlaC factor YlaD
VSSTRTLTCKELTEVLTDYLEGTMALEDRVALEAHLVLCEGCATYVEQMRQAIRTVYALRVDDVEATAPDSLLEAFRAWKRGEPAPGS